tara:strand:- start:188 stop:592 length:405 start_codon:yes stop_codon:yes gene_type:complete
MIIDLAFLFITIAIICIALIGLLLSLYMSLKQRKQELAILRSMGCKPNQLFFLLVCESFIITMTGVLIGLILTLILGWSLNETIETKTGIIINLKTITIKELYFSTIIIISGIIISFFPGYYIYKKSLKETLDP